LCLSVAAISQRSYKTAAAAAAVDYNNDDDDDDESIHFTTLQHTIHFGSLSCALVVDWQLERQKSQLASKLG
jgi:hypothetical protein